MRNARLTPNPCDDGPFARWFADHGACLRTWLGRRVGCPETAADLAQEVCVRLAAFGRNNGRSASGEPFEAQRGEQYEVGVKAEWWDGRLSSTLGSYNLTKTNLLTADLSTPDRFDSIAIGEACSRGIELDVSGRVTERLSLIASYAYTEITKDPGQDELGNPTPGNQGNDLPGAPAHAGLDQG